MLKLGRLYFISRWFELLTLQKNTTNYLQEENYKTTCIPHHSLYSIFEKYGTNIKPLFIA